MSMKKVENPVTQISRYLRRSWVGRTRRRVLRLRTKWGEHDQDGDHRADGGGQARAEGAHVAGEDEEVIAEDVEDAAGQHRRGGQGGVFVIAQVGRQRLGKEKAGDDKFNGPDILPRQDQGVPLRAEELQQRSVKQGDGRPHHRGQHSRAEDGKGKVFIGPADLPVALSADGAQQHRPADAHEQPQAVNDVPDGGHHRQRRSPLRPVVLAHHGHVHNGVDGGDQRAAEGGGQILEVKGFDLAVQ